jgi:pyruvate-ferredoxin/flavodoxin oxidoreductase
MSTGLHNQRAAVDSGQWILYRYNPDLEESGKNPLTLDSKPPQIPVEEYMYMENRFRMLTASQPDEAHRLTELAQEDANARRKLYEYLAARPGTLQSPNGG